MIIVGFRAWWDYLKRTATPNFDRVRSNGVIAERGLKNAFLTKTLPNHFTIATGLWEESHGIVGNTMYDPVLKEKFVVTNKSAMSDPRWFDVGAEPIWVTNQLQKNNGRSGCVMWVGCEAPIKGTTPTRHIPFDGDMPNRTRIDKIMDWFTGEYPVNLGLLYFNEPDHTAHTYGPESPEVTNMIAGLDDVMGYLLDQLKEFDLLEKTNIIITSDHGFAATSDELMVNLDDYIDPTSYRIFSSNPVAAILPNPGMEDSIYRNLSEGAKKPGAHFQVYKKEDIPPQYHFTHNRRIMPIIVVAKENYSIAYNGSQTHYSQKGEHGYNNSLQDMHPFFLAMGPGFRPGAAVDSFNNVDIYPLMCHLLDLHPAPNNGSLDAVRSLLRDEEEEETTLFTFGTYFFVLLVIASVGGVFAVAACRQHRYLKRMQRNRVISMQGGVQYSIPPANGGAKVPLLSESEEEEFH
nr:hypothetical protein BaRGS_009329 [Batillaria attramentaria]